MNNYIISGAIKANERGIGKPNEDFFYVDAQQQIMMVLDGITRPHREYDQGQDPVGAVNSIFSAATLEYLRAHSGEPAGARLKNALSRGNRALLSFREAKSLAQWEYYPATLGILALVEADRLWFCQAGDCIGMLIRDGVKIIFAEQQTTHALKILQKGKKERYESICNQPACPYGYPIFNGDDTAEAMLKSTGIALEKGDTVFLASDGLADCLRYEAAEILCAAEPEELLSRSAPYDRPPYSLYADDKAIIKMVVE